MAEKWRACRTGRVWRAGGPGALVALTCLALVGSAAAEVPLCTARTAGQLSVQANVQCGCKFFPASDVAGTPAGYRWDCGILRARNNHEVPATANPYPYPLPNALGLDRTIVLQRQGGAPGAPRAPR